MNVSSFFQLVSSFREVYFNKTFGQVVMLVARGDPAFVAKAKEVEGTELDCALDDTKIWAFVKHIGLTQE